MRSAVSLRVDTVEQASTCSGTGLFTLDSPLVIIGSVSDVGTTSVGTAVQERMGKGAGVMRQFTTTPERRAGAPDRLVFGTTEVFEAMAVGGRGAHDVLLGRQRTDLLGTRE